MSDPRVFYEGTENEPFEVRISATTILDAQTVEVSFDEASTWIEMDPDGDAGKVRDYTVTVSTADLPLFPFDTVAKFRIDGVIRPGLNRRVIGLPLP